MQFTLVARDGQDDGALQRRMAVREQHMALMDRLRQAGTALFAAALLNDDDQMVGSMLVLDFPSRADLDAYLAEEPYLTGNVWQDVQVLPCRVAPSFGAGHPS